MTDTIPSPSPVPEITPISAEPRKYVKDGDHDPECGGCKWCRYGIRPTNTPAPPPPVMPPSAIKVTKKFR